MAETEAATEAETAGEVSDEEMTSLAVGSVVRSSFERFNIFGRPVFGNAPGKGSKACMGLGKGQGSEGKSGKSGKKNHEQGNKGSEGKTGKRDSEGKSGKKGSEAQVASSDAGGDEMKAEAATGDEKEILQDVGQRLSGIARRWESWQGKAFGQS